MEYYKPVWHHSETWIQNKNVVLSSREVWVKADDPSREFKHHCPFPNFHIPIPFALDNHRARHQATVDSPPYTTQTAQERFQWVMRCLLYPDLTSGRNPITYSSFTVLCPASPIVALFHCNPSHILRMHLRRLGFLWEKGAFQADSQIGTCSLCYPGSSVGGCRKIN